MVIRQRPCMTMSTHSPLPRPPPADLPPFLIFPISTALLAYVLVGPRVTTAAARPAQTFGREVHAEEISCLTLEEFEAAAISSSKKGVHPLIAGREKRSIL